MVSDTGAAAAKAELLATFAAGEFSTGSIALERMDNAVFQLCVNCAPVDLEVVDTCGLEQEPARLRQAFRFHDIVLPHVVAVVVDLGCPAQLQAVGDRWAPELRQNCPGVPWIVVGTRTEVRIDIPGQEQQHLPTSQEDCAHFAVSVGATAYVECSARHNRGVHDVFQAAAQLAMNYQAQLGKKGKQNRFAWLGICMARGIVRRFQSK